jgi:hypothetical protein
LSESATRPLKTKTELAEEARCEFNVYGRRFVRIWDQEMRGTAFSRKGPRGPHRR